MVKRKTDIPAESRLDEIDALIEQALRDDVVLPVPATLHKRVTEQVRLVALYERERKRFRYSMFTLSVSLVVMLGAAAGLLIATNFYTVMLNGVSGAKGQYDSLVVSLGAYFSGYTGAYTLLVSAIVAAVTVFLALTLLWGHPKVRNISETSESAK
jgi:NhaP-type Na+/H+ or K+/H+ antiporter